MKIMLALELALMLIANACSASSASLTPTLLPIPTSTPLDLGPVGFDLGGVAVDSQGNFYVADNRNHRIRKFDSSGNFLLKWGSAAAAGGDFGSPWDIAVDSEGNVYVADYSYDNVQKFRPK